MKNLTVLIVSVLLVFMGFCISTNTAIASDGGSDITDVVLDANQAP